jgi:hypothetical protein
MKDATVLARHRATVSRLISAILEKQSKQLEFTPRLSSYSVCIRMKNTSSGMLFWFRLALLWVCQVAAQAQDNPYGNTLTNIYQVPTNNYQFAPVGPTTSASAMFSGPFMGTSTLAGPLAPQAYVPVGPPLAEWGPIGVYPHLLYQVTYGDGIEAQPGVNSTTFVNTVSPGVYFKLGSHWSLDYTPSLAFYSNPIFRDTTDQKVILNGGTVYRDWTLYLTQSYIDTTQPLVETGTQVEQEAYATAFNAAWEMSSKTTLQLGLNQNFRFAEGLNNIHEWTTADWFNYQFQPQLSAALGATFGYDELSLGSDMPFEQGLGRVIFQPGTKLRLLVIGGLEDRQFDRPPAPSEVTPIFQALGMYQIGDGTLLTVSAQRTVVASLLANQVNDITTTLVSVRQKIIGSAFAEISGGYTDESYTDIVPGPAPPGFYNIPIRSDHVEIRSDSRAYARISLTTVIHTRLTASIFYMYFDNSSSQANFKYSGDQGGLDLNYRW